MHGCLQVELPANTKIEYKYVILEEQVRYTVLYPFLVYGCMSFLNNKLAYLAIIMLRSVCPHAFVLDSCCSVSQDCIVCALQHW